jgi:hypothetical protein
MSFIPAFHEASMNAVAAALDLSDGMLANTFLLCLLIFGLLFLCDVFDLVSWPVHWKVQKPWPTEDADEDADIILTRFIYPGTLSERLHGNVSTRTYEEMFAEPPRVVLVTTVDSELVVKPALCSRPGNTYSNLSYVYAAILVLYSNLGGGDRGSDSLPFFLADVTFGVMLLVLAALSVAWHASNYNVVQYYDLWAMDFCIGYSLIRLVCVGLSVPLASVMISVMGFSHAKEGLSAAGTVCLVVTITYLVSSFRDRETTHGPQLMSCSFTGRRRLVRGELDVVGACLFLGMPVVYLVPPIVIQLFVLNDFGSAVLAAATAGALAVGWVYRFTERFCLDGNPVMTWMWERREIFFARLKNRAYGHYLRRGSIFETLTDACLCFFSPTAVLHWWTGFTLLFANAHARSLEQALLFNGN